MIDHLVETCADDLGLLKRRLDELAAEGAEIVTVLWQANRVENDQSAAYEARGSFVIVARAGIENPLRARGAGEPTLGESRGALTRGRGRRVGVAPVAVACARRGPAAAWVLARQRKPGIEAPDEAAASSRRPAGWSASRAGLKGKRPPAAASPPQTRPDFAERREQRR